MHTYSPQKMHTHSCMRAYATVQKFLCHGSYCEHILSLARASCRLSFAARPAAASRNQSSDAVCPRNPSKSTLAHNAVAAAVSYKHHSIICVGAGLIQFVYGSHSHLAADLIPHRNLFPPFFSRALHPWYLLLLKEGSSTKLHLHCLHLTRLCSLCHINPISPSLPFVLILLIVVSWSGPWPETQLCFRVHLPLFAGSSTTVHSSLILQTPPPCDMCIHRYARDKWYPFRRHLMVFVDDTLKYPQFWVDPN